MLSLLPVSAGDASEIPYFARRYGVTCTQCHVAPPKLNAFGEDFVARGYEMPGLVPRGTWPVALWITGRNDDLPNVEPVRRYLNRLEVISGGKVVAPWLSYFIEWRPVSFETRADGSLRDRSGRFEDLLAIATLGRWDITAGQFRLLSQVDVSRRLGIAEPLVYASGLPGIGGGSAREVGLRGFTAAGRSPAVRVAWYQPVGRGWRWTTSVAVPFPGELSLPLTSESRIEASAEFEASPKGLFLDAFARRQLFSVGGHVFYDHRDRYLASIVTTGRYASLYWSGAAGLVRYDSVTRGRWSLEAEVLPWSALGAGARIEDQGADALRPAVVTYLNAHFPGTRYTLRLTLERRIQRDRHATLLEIGAVF